MSAYYIQENKRFEILTGNLYKKSVIADLKKKKQILELRYWKKYSNLVNGLSDVSTQLKTEPPPRIPYLVKTPARIKVIQQYFQWHKTAFHQQTHIKGNFKGCSLDKRKTTQARRSKIQEGMKNEVSGVCRYMQINTNHVRQ